MKKIKEILSLQVAGQYNHVHVKTQEYLVEGSQKTKLGMPHREVIKCGDITGLKNLGIDKMFNLNELWPSDLIKEFNAGD